MPHLLLAADARALRERIDHPGPRGTGGGRDEHRHHTARAVCADLRAEVPCVEPPLPVGADQPQRIAADAGLMHDLEPGRLAFARGVHRHGRAEGAHAFALETRRGARERAQERRVVGFRTGGGEMPDALFRQAGASGDGADDVRLDLHRRRG